MNALRCTVSQVLATFNRPTTAATPPALPTSSESSNSTSLDSPVSNGNASLDLEDFGPRAPLEKPKALLRGPSTSLLPSALPRPRSPCESSLLVQYGDRLSIQSQDSQNPLTRLNKPIENEYASLRGQVDDLPTNPEQRSLMPDVVHKLPAPLPIRPIPQSVLLKDC